MTLNEFLKKSKLSSREFGDQVGVNTVSVNRYRRGARIPRPHIMKRIQELTRGEVTFQDMVEVYRQDEHA